MTLWKLFFSDGTTFDSSQGAPSGAPTKSVAIIHQQDGRCGRRVLKLNDWYRWCPRTERWYDCEEFDVLYQLTMQGSVVARRGEYLPEADFERLLILAHNDIFVPRISPDTPPHPAWQE